ncbi:bifunctional riboflavin kinase/FAD synthetase [Roseimaritima sediminicola]|uniref:bifunctional riboflavin kinase/FAD synthetase n=1 Tax=Roseimaritima sediminicola TaxID=2662066 RepID=UPI0012983BEA|nr:bifunctional riboflavin kinase/FAD synthetase [Roseimaritima sediminicola]
MIPNLYRSFDQLSDAARGGAVSIGNFDGVHRGHARLVDRLCEAAARLGGPAVAVTFDPHPAAILRPERQPPRLTTIERRAELLMQLGATHVVVCPVDRDFLQLSAERFFNRVIVQNLRARALVEGPNFFFGREREGDVTVLEQFSREAGIELTVVDPIARDEAMISSSQIRRLLAAGQIAEANSRLTAVYRLSGQVGRGDQRGRHIGFPTANVQQPTTMVPGHGVYATTVRLGDRVYAAATHIGPNPTFGGDTEKIEVHVLDFAGDLYGQWLSVDFLARVRDIAAFDSVQQLREQLRRDVAQVQAIVAEVAP